MKGFVLTITVAQCFGLASPACAQAAEAISLTDAVRRAKHAVGPVIVSAATHAQAKQEERVARASYLPSLKVEGGLGVGYANQPYVPGLPRYEGSAVIGSSNATVDWVVVDPARGKQVDAAAQRSHRQGSAVRVSELKAMQTAAELYIQSVAAAELVDDSQLTIERRSRQFDAISNLIKAGLRPEIDAERARIDVLSAQHQLEIGRIEERAALASLAAVLGDPRLVLRQGSGFNDDALPPPRTPEQAAQVALQRRPEFEELRAQLTVQDLERLATERERAPKLGVQMTGSASRRDFIYGEGLQGAFYSAGAALYARWTLDSSRWRKPRAAAAAVEVGMSQLKAARLAIESEAIAAAYEVARAAASVAQATEVLQGAERTRTVQAARYASGIASLLELLDAESVEQNARRQRVLAVRDHRLARTHLLAVCGEIEVLANGPREETP